MAQKRRPSRRPSRKRSSEYNRRVAVGIVVACVVLGLLLWGPFKKTKQAEHRPVPPKKQEQAERPPGRRQPAAEVPRAPERRVLVAIVIDDLGQDLKAAREVLALSDVTFAIMPRLPHSTAIADLARRNNRQVLLHLPMERKNLNGKPLAPGTLRADMTPMEFLETLEGDIESVPGASGVNNHEGSALTGNKEAMNFLMAELKSRDLFFLDSLTDPNSVAFSTAREFGLKSVRRDVFLDNDNGNPAAIRAQLAELEKIARKRGSAIGIGHPHPTTLAEIRAWLNRAEDQGIDIVPVSRLVK